MEDIEVKSFSCLLDEFVTTSLRMWHLQDEIVKSSDPEAGRMAKQLQSLNARRASLMRAVDSRFKEKYPQPPKTYS